MISPSFSHLDPEGRTRMVDVGGKSGDWTAPNLLTNEEV